MNPGEQNSCYGNGKPKRVNIHADKFLAEHLGKWLEGLYEKESLSYRMAFDYIVEFIWNEDDPQYWLNQGWNRVLDQVTKLHTGFK